MNKALINKSLSDLKKNLNRYNIPLNDDLKSLKDFQKFLSKLDVDLFDLKKRQNKKKILSVEYNIGHDIIRPSIYKYFSDLGYEVDFLLAEFDDKKRWNFFERINHTNERTVTGSYLFIDAVLSGDNIKEYDFILFNTSFIFMEDHINSGMNCLDSLLKNTKKIPQPKYGFLHIPPHLSQSTPEAEDALIQSQFLNGIPVLSHLGYRGLPMLSAHYFGNVNIKPNHLRINFWQQETFYLTRKIMQCVKSG